jgi:hypothetical protein
VRAHSAAAVLALVLVSVPVPVLGVVTGVACVPGIVLVPVLVSRSARPLARSPPSSAVRPLAALEATEVALELVRSMRPVVQTLARHDRDLAIDAPCDLQRPAEPCRG